MAALPASAPPARTRGGASSSASQEPPMAVPFAPGNSDLPSSYENPGVYFQLRSTGAGAANTATSKRALIWGHKLGSGTGQFNSPLRCPGLQQAILYAGQGSDAVRAF